MLMFLIDKANSFLNQCTDFQDLHKINIDVKMNHSSGNKTTTSSTEIKSESTP